MGGKIAGTTVAHELKDLPLMPDESNGPAGSGLALSGLVGGRIDLEFKNSAGASPEFPNPGLTEEITGGFSGVSCCGELEHNGCLLVRRGGGDQLFLIDDLPSLWEIDPEGHPRMIESASRDITLPGIGAEDQTPKVLEIAIPQDQGFGWAPAELLNLCVESLAPVLGAGVGGLPFREARASRQSGLPFEHIEDLGHLLGPVVPPHEVAKPQRVRLAFVVSAELQKKNPEAHLCEIRVLSKVFTGDHGNAEPKLGKLRSRKLFDAVAGRHMPDLMTEYRCHLRLGIEGRENSAGDEDVASRQGEGVDRRVIDDMKLPGKLGAFGLSGEFFPDFLDISLQGLVLLQTDLRLDLFRIVSAHGNFLLFSDQRKLAMTGCRIEGAGDGDHQGKA